MSVFNITEHVIGASHVREYARATSDDQDATLSLHIKQYTPKDNPSPHKGDVTIIGGHANGFPKVTSTFTPLDPPTTSIQSSSVAD